jgi:hypothetical protein
LVKTESQLFMSLKGSPENQFFLNLISLLENRLETIKNDMVDSDEVDHRIQKGRARELKHLISGLTRKPVSEQYTGSFN